MKRSSVEKRPTGQNGAVQYEKDAGGGPIKEMMMVMMIKIASCCRCKKTLKG